MHMPVVSSTNGMEWHVSLGRLRFSLYSDLRPVVLSKTNKNILFEVW
jgi:hypothetical protein